MKPIIIIGILSLLLFGCVNNFTNQQEQVDDTGIALVAYGLNGQIATYLVRTPFGCEVFCVVDARQGGITCDWERERCINED